MGRGEASQCVTIVHVMNYASSEKGGRVIIAYTVMCNT